MTFQSLGIRINIIFWHPEFFGSNWFLFGTTSRFSCFMAYLIIMFSTTPPPAKYTYTSTSMPKDFDVKHVRAREWHSTDKVVTGYIHHVYKFILDFNKITIKIIFLGVDTLFLPSIIKWLQVGILGSGSS